MRKKLLKQPIKHKLQEKKEEDRLASSKTHCNTLVHFQTIYTRTYKLRITPDLCAVNSTLSYSDLIPQLSRLVSFYKAPTTNMSQLNCNMLGKYMSF